MEYRSVRIKDVIDAINKDYFLPAIQREFVWEPAQIEKLFDSILGDYPIGSFLFWKVEWNGKLKTSDFAYLLIEEIISYFMELCFLTPGLYY